MANNEFKQYDTIAFAGCITDNNGNVYDLTGIELAADIMASNGETESMTVEITDAASGRFTLTAEKKERKIGRYSVDMLVTCNTDDYRSSRNQFDFYIKRAITAPRT